MVIQVQPHDLDPFYRRATEGYVTCLHKPENAYLHAEVPVPLPDIVVRHGEVKLVFSPTSVAAYQVEVHLGLYVREKYFGKYVSLMDATGEVLEDSLLFY